MQTAEIEEHITELESRVDRLRALYEQYFMGIEKIEPQVARKDVERRVQVLRREQIRNTAQRFRFQMILQRYNTFQTYWLRTCREIEEGTYKRHVMHARAKFGEAREVPKWGRRRTAWKKDGDEQAATPGEKSAEAPEDSSEELDLDSAESVEVVIAPVRTSKGPPRPPPPPPMGSLRPATAAMAGAAPAAPAPPKAAPAAPAPPPRGIVVATPVEFRPVGAEAAKDGGKDDRMRELARRLSAKSTEGGQAPSAPRVAAAAPASPGAPPAAKAAPPPAKAAPAPAKADAPPPAAPKRDLSDERMRQIYSELVETKRKQKESTAAVTYEAMVKTLRESSAKLREKHSGKSVDFEVTIKDGKTILRPVVK